jgi:hypothetical protein
MVEMNNQENITDLLERARALVALLEDAQTGLSTWQQMYEIAVGRLLAFFGFSVDGVARPSDTTPKIITVGQMQVGDVVRLASQTFSAWMVCVVYKIEVNTGPMSGGGLIHFFRPFVKTDSHRPDIATPYIGFEQFSTYLQDTGQYYLLRREGE